MTTASPTLRKAPWWEKTPATTPCGRCDVDYAGPGAEMVSVPGLGLIVACADCLRDLREESTPPEDDDLSPESEPTSS